MLAKLQGEVPIVPLEPSNLIARNIRLLDDGRDTRVRIVVKGEEHGLHDPMDEAVYKRK